MSSRLVHMVGDHPFRLKLGKEVHTRCGLDAIPTCFFAEELLYTLTNTTGGDFEGATIKSKVTCQKCINLITIGMIHAKSSRPNRTADAEERKAVVAAAAKPHTVPSSRH